jgi:hypothetical protein
MELICNVCGSIGIWFPKLMAEAEARIHVEGNPTARRPKPPHPGHVVAIVPDSHKPII